MEKDSACYIGDAKQVLSHLNRLIKNKCLLSVHFGVKNDSFITTILELDRKKNRLLFDYGPMEYLNRQLLESRQIEFRCDYEGIKVAFTVEKLEAIRRQGQKAFAATIPDSIFWQQRRQFYRVKIPASHQSYCEIKLPEHDQAVRFRLLNLSISGFCFINERVDLSEALLPTVEFNDCAIQLNGSASETVSFVIKNKFTLHPEKIGKGQRIGCAFTKLTTAGESRILRYMQQIELEGRILL